jgi:hypothetical protein
MGIFLQGTAAYKRLQKIIEAKPQLTDPVYKEDNGRQ